MVEKNMNKRRWEPIQKLWDMGFPVSFIIKVSGHSSGDSFRKHVKVLRKSWGDSWFKPRNLGFKPVYNVKDIV